MKIINPEKEIFARKLLSDGVSFDNIIAQIKKDTRFEYGISRKKLVELRKEMLNNRKLDNSILKKLLIPFAKLGVEVDLETNEIKRITQLFEEVKLNA